jgi:hypothetical protein
MRWALRVFRGVPDRLGAVVPVSAISVRVGPIPAQVGRRPRRYVTDCGDGNQGAERDPRNDSAVVRPRPPGTTVPIGPAGPTCRSAPRRSAPPARSSAPTRICTRSRGIAPTHVRARPMAPVRIHILNWFGQAGLVTRESSLRVEGSGRCGHRLRCKGNRQKRSGHRVLCHPVKPPVRLGFPQSKASNAETTKF